MGKKAKDFFQLGIALVVIWAVRVYVCPAVIEVFPAYKAYAEALDSRGIATSALFYTDVEEAGEAELNIRNALRFPPKARVPEK